MSEHLQFQLEMYCQGINLYDGTMGLGEMKESPENLACTGTVHAGRNWQKYFRELEIFVKFVVVGVKISRQ